MTSTRSTIAMTTAVLAASVWIYFNSRFRIVMWLRYVALCLAVVAWLLLPRMDKKLVEKKTPSPATEPEHETRPSHEDNEITAIDNESSGANDRDDTEADETKEVPEFVCSGAASPSLQRRPSRDVLLTTQEEKWARDANGNMYRSQSCKRVLIKCPTSENAAVLQSMGSFAAQAIPQPSLAAASSPMSFVDYLTHLSSMYATLFLEFAIKSVGSAIFLATCGVIWNFALGINAEVSFHALVWKHLQDFD
ncbi:hypothetical protein Ae201684P_021858 [Aphanomyces euteiches]|uniref:Uncharacterized protein n=1 Tax=Aphanomyces euteiches TaxID=100861 RepID=A0A6G0WSZ4_9STRA|nr:hypothetical protein Ae201684_012028 [Aphanomyces euteiches]KAH9056121.1 hypothetical protein Ae201684P_021858 [Aphanomyces euteiches]